MFEYDWLVVLIEPDTQNETVIVNNATQLEGFYNEHKNDIWVGYNNLYYDQYILRGILCGFNPKKVNDHIIVKEKAGYTFSSLFNKIPMINYDTMIMGYSLKQLEGFMGNMIKETSIPFDIDRKLTDDEIEETIKYCRHDVMQTIEVFMHTISEFNTMLYFIKHFNYPLRYLEKTKAQLSAIMLGGNSKGKSFKDEFDFEILPCIELKKYRYIAEWYGKPENKTYTKAQTSVMVAGVEHTFSWGGGHGAIPNYHGKGVFLIIDVTAYYPSLQEKYKFGYRVMNSPENFEFIHGSNIKYKRMGDKKARQPFKIMDNAISGQLKQSTSMLFDPMSNNSICVNGQMLLLDLIEHLEPHIKLIQNNTDGIIVKLKDYDRDFDIIDDIVYEWEQRTGMKMDFDTFFGEIYQKDVNNYILIDRETGAYKAKGSYIKKLSEIDNNLPIVNKAMVEYFVNGAPIEDTINQCQDLKQFQMICKITGKYKCLLHGDKELAERCVRVFASKDRKDKGLFKLHKNKSKPDKFPSTPVHCFIENGDVNNMCVPDKLDRNFYINMAKERVKGYGIV